MNVMYLDGKSVLHITDEGTRFSAAKFLPDVLTCNVYRIMLEGLVTITTGLSHKFLVVQGSNFGTLFADMASVGNVTIERTPIQSHKSLGLGERYSEQLRRSFRKLKLDHQSEFTAVFLAISIKALNITLGADGLVPSELPSLQLLGRPLDPRASLLNRAQLSTDARKAIEKAMDQA